MEHIIPYQGFVDMIALCRSNVKFLVFVMRYVVAQQGKVKWPVLYETYLHGHYQSLRGRAYVRLRSETYKLLPKVMSRACRGCGRRTDRRVYHVPLCEKCTKDRKRTWCMVGTLRVPYKWYRGIRVHSGRRTNLVFVQDMVNAGRVCRAAVFNCLGT